MRYGLIATKENGNAVCMYGDNGLDVLARFDLMHSRSGFKIQIFDSRNNTVKTIKKTYR